MGTRRKITKCSRFRENARKKIRTESSQIPDGCIENATKKRFPGFFQATDSRNVPLLVRVPNRCATGSFLPHGRSVCRLLLSQSKPEDPLNHARSRRKHRRASGGRKRGTQRLECGLTRCPKKIREARPTVPWNFGESVPGVLESRVHVLTETKRKSEKFPDVETQPTKRRNAPQPSKKERKQRAVTGWG